MADSEQNPAPTEPAATRNRGRRLWLGRIVRYGGSLLAGGAVCAAFLHFRHSPSLAIHGEAPADTEDASDHQDSASTSDVGKTEHASPTTEDKSPSESQHESHARTAEGHDEKPEPSVVVDRQRHSESRTESSGSTPHGTEEPHASEHEAPAASLIGLGESLRPLDQIDELIGVGSFTQAMTACERLAAAPEWASSVELRYRYALVLERLKRLDEAQRQYVTLLDSGASTNLANMARLGQARCWFGQGRAEPARSQLWSMLVRGELNPSQYATAFHTCAQLLGNDVQSLDHDLLSDESILEPSPKNDDSHLIMLAGAVDSAEATGPEGAELLTRIGDDPETIQVRLRYASQPMSHVLEAVGHLVNAAVSYDQTAERVMRSRMQTVSVSDLSLAIVLDSLLEPAGYTWKLESGQLQLMSIASMSPNDLKQLRTQQATRMCRTALAVYSDSPESPATYMTMGNLQFIQGNDLAAISAYRELIRRTDGREFGYEVAFNLAKALLRSEQREEARNAFFRVVDSAHGQSILAVAYLYIGRIDLEDNLPQNATRELGRALTFAQSDEVKCTSAITLACAYLLEKNPEVANQTLMDHRELFTTEPSRTNAAFVSALARSRVATVASDRLRRQRELTAALSNVVPRRFFGSVGYLLVGEAFEECELDDQMEAVFNEGIKATKPHALRQAMMYKVANYLYDVGRWDELDKWYATFDNPESPAGMQWAKMRRAEIAYKRGQHDDCLSLCYEALAIDLPDSDKKEVLTLMGKIFEHRNDYYKAALCFAGMVPTASGAAEGDPE